MENPEEIKKYINDNIGCEVLLSIEQDDKAYVLVRSVAAIKRASWKKPIYDYYCLWGNQKSSIDEFGISEILTEKGSRPRTTQTQRFLEFVNTSKKVNFKK